jgi:hypothetical protein
MQTLTHSATIRIRAKIVAFFPLWATMIGEPRMFVLAQ